MCVDAQTACNVEPNIRNECISNSHGANAPAPVFGVHQFKLENLMNSERLVGVCREFTAKMNETWGEITGDPLRVDAGRLGQIRAKNQQRSGIESEQSRRQMRDFLYRNRNWHI